MVSHYEKLRTLLYLFRILSARLYLNAHEHGSVRQAYSPSGTKAIAHAHLPFLQRHALRLSLPASQLF
jgi:hypothetical protein